VTKYHNPLVAEVESIFNLSDYDGGEGYGI